MQKNKHSYAHGDRQCFHCEDDLPAFNGFQHLTYACPADECQAAHRTKFTHPRRMKQIAAEVIRCQAPDCQNWVPAGTYMERKNRFFCSTTCSHRFYEAQNVVGTCLYCTGEIRDVKSSKNRKFCSRKHQRRYYAEIVFAEKAGPFADVLNEYLEGVARNNYKPSTWDCARTNLLHFGSFLQQVGITDLRAVKPKTITAFIRHEHARGVTAENNIGHVSTFFHWLEAEERVDRSPVIPSIHKATKSLCIPRPLTDAELDCYWELLDKDDCLQLKVALALGEESGLRIGEVANLRLGDVDLNKLIVHVRTPNKNDTPRDVPCSSKTVLYVREWLLKRDPSCPTDHLIHSMVIGPYTSSTLNRVFQSRLKIRNGGPVPFSFHRCRHTWASRLINAGIEPAVLMELGGWQSWEAMKHYVKVLQTTIDRSYREAVDNIRKQKEEGVEQVFSLADFANISTQSADTPLSERG